MAEPREPQSYGSDKDWTTGMTGQHVNDPKSSPPPEHEAFYSERREEEQDNDAQGGLVSPVQLAENNERTGEATRIDPTAGKVNGHEGGAKRDSFFKRRDYE